MVESYIKMKREDYLKVIGLLEKIDGDINAFRTEKNKNLVIDTRNKIAVILNLLSE